MEKAMKKTSVRRISLMLSLLVTASLAAACGDTAEKPAEDTKPTVTTEAVTEDTSYHADYLPDVDYGGYEYRVLDYEEYPIEIGEQSGSIINDAIYTRNRLIEERYNIHFVAKTFLYTNYPDVKSEFDRAGRAQSDDFELAELTFRDAYNTILEGLAPAAACLPCTDLTQPWYKQSINDSLTIGGVALMGYTALESMPGGGGVIFNKKLVNDLDLDSPYDLVDNGTWTIDKFYAMGMEAISDVDGNGKYEVGDRFGMITEWDRISMVAYYGSGHMLVHLEDGIPVASTEELLVDAFTNCLEYSNTPGFMLDTFKTFGQAESSRVEGYQLFKQGQGMFLVTGTSTLTTFGDMEDDYGVVPHPKWSEDQDRYYCPPNYGTLACSTDLERVCVIKEALAVESLNIVTPAFYDNALKNRYLRDQDSVRMVEIISQSGIVDLGQSPWWDIVRAPWQNTLVSGKPNFASAVEKNMPKCEDAINKMLEMVERIKEELEG